MQFNSRIPNLVYYLQYLLLENNITDYAQERKIVYIFQLKSFEHNNVIFFHVFLRKCEQLIMVEGEEVEESY